MILLMNVVILTICVLLSIAFFTLMERKVISFTQNRKGPNKVAINGILQPIADAIKLLSKQMNMNLKSNLTLYFLSPCINILCSLILWAIMPLKYEFGFMKMSSIFMISCMAMNTISLMMMSWASNSNYAFIGMMRTISQLISYEINLMMIIITIINFTNQMTFSLMWKIQEYSPLIIFIAPLTLLWLVTILAETNRTPFDFSEGESELISGFNIEYSSNSFMLLFLAEYSSILTMSLITPLMFTSLKPVAPPFYLTYFMTCFFFVWIRATFPRFRYDKLMKFNWTQALPMTTFILFMSFATKLNCAMKS